VFQRGDAMSLTILYHHLRRPDKARMTMIVGQSNVEATVARLEKKWFQRRQDYSWIIC
jgi:hypothetical protein